MDRWGSLALFSRGQSPWELISVSQVEAFEDAEEAYHPSVEICRDEIKP